MGAAPLRPSMRPSQYSSTVLPSGFTVPMPVTTTRLPFCFIPGLRETRLARQPCSLAQRLTNLTDEVCLDRLPGNPDGVPDGQGVRAAVRHDRHALDPEERCPAE